jgi:hypothetical protein
MFAQEQRISELEKNGSSGGTVFSKDPNFLSVEGKTVSSPKTRKNRFLHNYWVI